MPLPLPNLDTRRWDDLVAEGRALIPRYAPSWTDHNVHDPGITVLELLAWLVEQEIYRVNRVPERHRRKFLALAGFPPAPPQPAQAALSFSLAPGASAQTLPAGLTLAAKGAGDRRYPFRTTAAAHLIPAAVAAVQVYDGATFVDQTRLWRDRLPFPLFGADPAATVSAMVEAQPAFYLGLDAKVEAGQSLTFWFWFANRGSDAAARARLANEAAALAAFCQPVRPGATCPPEEDSVAPGGSIEGVDDNLPPHHSVRVVWECRVAGGWRALDPEAGEVQDTTRGLTLDGPVHLSLPQDLDETAVGAVPDAYFYLRCRLAAGRPDAAPLLAGLAPNTVAVRQVSPARGTFVVGAGVAPPPDAAPAAGSRQRLHLVFGADGVVTELAAGPDVDGPEVLVLAYEPATAAEPGLLVATLFVAGHGSGLPDQQLALGEPPIAEGSAEIWIGEPDGLAVWRQRPDFDASERTDADFTLDATTGIICFGNGERGRVPPAGAVILAAYDSTAGAAGNLRADAGWIFSGADDALNEAVIGADLAALAGALEGIANLQPAAGGADAETVSHAAGRAAESLWAHERLVELCAPGACASLDQLARETVLARRAPARAVTLLDFERLALATPGVAISRVRAWAGLDAAFPCFSAPGTVTVIVMPYLPVGRPAPTPGLLDAVAHYLNRRRIVGTRLVVVGPDYMPVQVRAAVRARPNAAPARVQSDIVAALDAFLDPLHGGPAGRGWPFGRAVYRAEILQVIDGVAGVDHVLELEMIPGEGEAQCGNLCVGPTALVTPAAHEIDVVTGRP